MISKFGTFEYALADRYRFDAELGRGAMGIVYRARDVRLDRPVAIKMLHATLTNELGVARFQSEIRIAASLHHPNIVSVHDSGEADGRLFYVMDYLGGETLRTRLQREKQLSVDDALLIVEHIAEGLQFAHDRGVVHRDIKPENILLTDGIARVVDFGLARALGDVDTERLTASGLSVGTPQYLSPEQAAAEKNVGPRADQYGLACVLYEMLAGEPPFTGPTATAVAMRHISEVPASLGKRRRTTPPSVDVSVVRALEKVPADRFGSVREFAAALRSSDRREPGPTPKLQRRRFRALRLSALLSMLTVGFAVVAWEFDPGHAGVAQRLSVWIRPDIDSSRYVIFPFRGASKAASDLTDLALYDALSLWTGVDVVDPSVVGDAVTRHASAVLDHSAAASIARELHAGRYVLGEWSSTTGQARLRVALYDVAAPELPISKASLSAPIDSLPSESVFANLADSLLFATNRRTDDGGAPGTRSRPARQAYLSGWNALADWDLVLADSSFSAATRSDPQYARANLWLAQVRDWQNPRSTDIRRLASEAMRRKEQLSPREQTLAGALLYLASAEYDMACKTYDSIRAGDSTSFAAWYGLAECRSRDNVVLPDPTSISHWRFRSSYHQAIAAYLRAFELLPSIHKAFQTEAYSRLRSLLKTDTRDLRGGRAVGADSAQFLAYPSWSGDTLAFIPWPARDHERALSRTIPSTLALAVDHERELFLTIARGWATSLPNSSDAIEALAIAEELVGDPEALKTCRRARALATDDVQRVRLAASEVWLRLKFALPDHQTEILAATVLADSLLSRHAGLNPAEARTLAGLAALTGKLDRAQQLASNSATLYRLPFKMRPDVAALGHSLLILAPFGEPLDSIRQLEARIAIRIENDVPREAQSIAWQLIVGRAVTIAFPRLTLASVSRFAGGDHDYLLSAELAFARGDSSRARMILDTLSNARRGLRPADISIDALYPEVWLLDKIGAGSEAVRRLDSTLDALPTTAPQYFDDVARPGALIEAMLLRSSLARHVGDLRTAVRWGCAVKILWSNANPELIAEVNTTLVETKRAANCIR